MLSHVPGQWLWRGPRIERILERALHLSIVWAVARFAQRLGSSRTGAWFGAALLAGHPAASETVAWIAVRGDLLGVTLLTYGFLALSFGRDRLAGLLLGVACFLRKANYVPRQLRAIILDRWRACLELQLSGRRQSGPARSEQAG